MAFWRDGGVHLYTKENDIYDEIVFIFAKCGYIVKQIYLEDLE
jgi:hypothetical protein